MDELTAFAYLQLAPGTGESRLLHRNPGVGQRFGELGARRRDLRDLDVVVHDLGAEAHSVDGDLPGLEFGHDLDIGPVRIVGSIGEQKHSTQGQVTAVAQHSLQGLDDIGLVARPVEPQGELIR